MAKVYPIAQTVLVDWRVLLAGLDRPARRAVVHEGGRARLL